MPCSSNDRALELNRRLTEAFHGRVPCAGGKEIHGALRDLDRAIRISPRYHEAILNRGVARHATGDLPGAITDFDRAI